QPTIGTLVDGAMTALERENPTLREVLPKGYGRPTLDKQRLGELVDLFTNLDVGGKARRPGGGPGGGERGFLGGGAAAEGEQGGQGGGGVLHAGVGGKGVGGDAGAVQGAGVRPVLRIGRDVRAVGEIRGGAQRAVGGHLDLPTGEQPDDMAAGEDESCDKE